MKAPLCKICGVAHWGNEAHHLTEKSLEHGLREIAAEAKAKGEKLFVVPASAKPKRKKA